MIKLQHWFQKGRNYSSSPMILIIFKHQFFLITFNTHSNHVTSIVLLLLFNEIANLRCAVYIAYIKCIYFLIIELISKVFIVISNTLELTSSFSLEDYNTERLIFRNEPQLNSNSGIWVCEFAADKTIQNLDSCFKVYLRVLNKIDHGSKFCLCHLYTVINFNVFRVRFVLGNKWANIYKLSRVLKRYIMKTDHSIRVFIFDKHMVQNHCFCFWCDDTKTIISKYFIKSGCRSLQ